MIFKRYAEFGDFNYNGCLLFKRVQQKEYGQTIIFLRVKILVEYKAKDFTLNCLCGVFGIHISWCGGVIFCGNLSFKDRATALDFLQMTLGLKSIAKIQTYMEWQ